MDAHELQHEAELDFDIDVELPTGDDAPWADDCDIIELSAVVEG